MTLEKIPNQDWRRFHDPKDLFQSTGVTLNCFDSAVDIIELCQNRPAGKKLKAAGSHWGLSTATVSDDDFIETNLPTTQTALRHSGLDIDLLHLIDNRLFQFLIDNPPVSPNDLSFDPCLRETARNCFFVHIKSGTRVYDTYSLLDSSPSIKTELAQKLNEQLAGGPHANAYDGPWAFATLGGAGGQTVFGALNTGTHGGDFRQRPISDSVMALHLVTDGGEHYWIEPRTSQIEFQITDDQKLRDTYSNLVPGVPFNIIRDNDIFNSVTVGVGRFGVVVSLVLRVVPQYCLHEHRRLDHWSKIKQKLISGPIQQVFSNVYFPGTPDEHANDLAAFQNRFGNAEELSNRFLQIAVNLSPIALNDRRCGVTQRWFYPHVGPEARDPSGEVRGRVERGLMSVAGKVGSYEPPDDTSEAGGNSTFLSRACSSGNFIAGLLRQAAAEIEEIVATGAVPAGGIAAAALGIGAGAAVLAIASVCAVLIAVALLLKELADDIEASGDQSLAAVIDKGVKAIVDNPAIPSALGVMIIRAIFDLVFKSQQSNRDFVAISYAVMDTHDYLDRSCFGNAESLEVFFDATRPDLYCAYVDEVLSFEAYQQEQLGRFSVGYVSLRYMLGSRALIAPSRFNQSVAIEIAAIRDAAGSVDFVMNAAKIARKPIYNAAFHWGQFNPLERHEVERHYGKTAGTKLDRWRNSLAKLTSGGARDGFSSEFTRRTGLEPN